MRVVDAYPEIARHVRYLQATDPDLLETFKATADIVEGNANDAYLRLPMGHGVHIPVDTARENEVGITLQVAESEAQQAEVLPHIVISGNHVPAGADKELVAHNTHLIEQFQRDNPDLPVSYFTRYNTPGMPIGLTRDLIIWPNIAWHVKRSAEQDVLCRDVPLTNWDADTLATTPGYLGSIQQEHAATDAEVFATGPLVVHQLLDNPIFPGANRLLRWNDYIQRASSETRPNSFTTNIVGWVRGQGFGLDSLSEGAELMKRAAANTPQDRIKNQRLDETVVTSNRRLVGKMALGEDLFYSELEARSGQRENLSSDALTSDVSEAYYQAQIEKLVCVTFSAAYIEKGEQLKRDGVCLSDVVQVAANYALEVVRTSSEELGQGPYADKEQAIIDMLSRGILPSYIDIKI